MDAPWLGESTERMTDMRMWSHLTAVNAVVSLALAVAFLQGAQEYGGWYYIAPVVWGFMALLNAHLSGRYWEMAEAHETYERVSKGPRTPDELDKEWAAIKARYINKEGS